MNSKPTYYRQSAVVPYRKNHSGLEVLMIRSMKGKWIVPKGLIEPGLSPQDSALKEALEEAGIKGTVNPDLIGEYEYKKWDGTCEVKVYAMRVDEMLDCWEEDFRERKWFKLQKAVRSVSNRGLGGLMNLLPLFVLDEDQ